MDAAVPAPESRLFQLVRVNPRELVPARAFVDLPARTLDEVEAVWNSARQLIGINHPGAEHTHWDWRNKAGTVASGSRRLVAVECDGQIQGLMALSARPRRGALDPAGRSVLYVDYLEVAPWNYRSMSSGPRFAGVGRRLMAEAVHLSFTAGFNGRVGLHSLRQAEEFYGVGCEMTRIGPDPGYYDLVYFEYDDEQATLFLGRAEL